VPKIDCLWFVTRLDDTRVSSDEKRAIRLIPAGCGKDIWERSIIVFTFANSVDLDRYDEACKKRTELIRLEIARWSNASVAANVPSVAIDNTSMTTPDGQTWLGELYITVFNRMSEHGFLPFFLATSERLVLPDSIVEPLPSQIIRVTSSETRSLSEQSSTSNNQSTLGTRPSINTRASFVVLNEKQATSIRMRLVRHITTRIAGGAIIGATIGTAFGRKVGAAIGGTIGAVIGVLIGLIPHKSEPN
jgi:tetrahydromethanopterin S-methyltransferase subunit G